MTPGDDDKEYPAFFLYWRDWITGTLLLNATQRGMFINLLAHSWGRRPPCTLPNDESALMKLASVDAETWRKESKAVLAKFDCIQGDKLLRNPMLYGIHRDMVQRTKRRARAGKASAAVRRIKQVELLPEQERAAVMLLPQGENGDELSVLLEPIVHGVLWLSQEPPHEDWTVESEVGIAKRLLKGGDVALSELVEAARCIRTVGNLPATEPVSLRIFAGKSARAKAMFNECVGMARKRLSLRPRKAVKG